MGISHVSILWRTFFIRPFVSSRFRLRISYFPLSSSLSGRRLDLRRMMKCIFIIISHSSLRARQNLSKEMKTEPTE